MYKNNGNSTFSSVNVAVYQKLNDSQLNALINVADFNNDGFQDFVIVYRDSIKFYKNNGGLTFIDMTNTLGINNPITNRTLAYNNNEGSGDVPSGGAWDDYDADGDLDYIIGTKDASNSYIEVFVNNVTSFNTRNIILTFPLPIHPSFILNDFDNDQDQDILILYFSNSNSPFSQYNYQPLKLYNNIGGTYNDVTTSSGLGQGSNHGFAQVWDYNNDGFQDIIMGSTNTVFNGTHTNRVYKNNGNNTFTDVSNSLNLKNGNGYYRKVYPIDFDLDSDIDVLYQSENHLFINNGTGVFSTDQISNTGVTTSDDILFFIDLNNDGKLDGLSYNLKGYLNNSSGSNNYVKIKLSGCTGLKDPRGARINLYANNKKQTQYLIGSSNSFDQNQPYSSIINFGLGSSNSIDSIIIYWPNAGTSKIIGANVNMINHINHFNSCNSISADGPTTFCAGNFVNLTSDVVGGTYQWKRNGVNIATNSTSRTFKATSTGSYTCVATYSGTALTSNAIQVTSQTNAAVTLTASGATSFCAGDSVTLNATNLGSGYSVQWYRTNISMQGATNYSVVIKQPGTYKTVTRNLANGCSRISSGSIITAVNCRMSNPAIIAVDPVSDEIPATKLGNSTETTMHLFPNPNAGSFTLEYDGIEADFEVQVVNTMGQVIYNDIIPSNDKHLKTTINLGDNMQKGIYVVRIINGENVQESKVMLQ